MRRIYLAAAVFSLPLANGLSLASFQQITSGLIPFACGSSYTAQIPICVANDFNTGCSSECISSLEKTEAQVQRACLGLIVNSRSLLGIVQAGGLVKALCVKGEKETTTTRTTTRAATTRTTPSIETPGRTSGRTTTTTTETASSTSTEDNAVPPTTPVPAPANGNEPTATTTQRAPTPTQRADQDAGDRSGGGSPFDIVNTSGGTCLESSSIISALALGGWAALMISFGR